MLFHYTYIILHQSLLHMRRLWQEGILPRCLSSILSTSPSEKGPLIGPLPSSSMAASSSTYTWIVLEGNLSPEQMDTLSSCTHDGTLLLPNGHPIRLDSSTTFIYEVRGGSVVLNMKKKSLHCHCTDEVTISCITKKH